jgi:hypothetical protein
MKLKNLLFVATIFTLLFATACDDDDKVTSTYPAKVQLVYPEGFAAKAGVKVTLENTITGAIFEAETDIAGVAEFTVIAGTYTATASDSYSISGNRIILSANKSNVVITDANTGNISLNLEKSKTGQVVIKEYYFNGCQQNVSGTFQRDPYVILYNNSDQPASLENLGFGATIVANSQATNNDYSDSSELFYAAEKWVPAGFGIFYFATNVVLEPGKQVVVAINSANDHTTTYSNSVNLANADYYVFYDTESGFNNTTFHPAPSALIPASHYLKAIRFPGVTSVAYTMSTMSPAFFIFSTENTTPVDYAANPDNRNLYNNSASQVRLKVPFDWVIDAVEVFQKGAAANKKRLPAAIDAGQIEFPDVKLGYTLYRNVDKAATEAIAENAGKLVYSYNGAAPEFTNDPSGIDAEASLKNGARIIYKDVNNSGNDFHVRAKSSLKN